MPIDVLTTPAAFRELQRLCYVLGAPIVLRRVEPASLEVRYHIASFNTYTVAATTEQRLRTALLSVQEGPDVAVLDEVAGADARLAVIASGGIGSLDDHLADLCYCLVNQYNEAGVVAAAQRFIKQLERELTC